MRDYLYVGISGHICAIDPQNGKEIWRTKIGNRYPVHFIRHEHQIIATIMGSLVAVDAKTGTILWKNKLEKLGFSTSTMSIADKSVQTQISSNGM